MTGGRREGLRSFGMPTMRVAALALVLTGLMSCAETSAPLPPPEEVVVVLNGNDATLSLIPIATPTQVSTVPLGASDVQPVTVTARGAVAVVPLRAQDAIAVIDLRAGQLVNTVSLAPGSGVAGAALISDSIAY